MLIRSNVSVTVVISAPGSSSRRRSVQRPSAESLPPLQESAKGAGGRSPSAAASPRRGERPGLESIVCPLTKTSASAEEEARRPGPPEPPFLRGLRSFRRRTVDLTRPRAGHRSCGAAPDLHQTCPPPYQLG